MKTNYRKNSTLGRIPLEGLPNTRDLGGIKTMDGKRILPGRLIRSGTLHGATQRDIQILTEQYCLGTVIDFRTATERKQKPDPQIPGIDNIFNPILDEKTVGITFEDEEEQAEEEKQEDAIKGILLHASSLGGKPENYVDRLYEDLVLKDHAAVYYGRFFELLLEADDRAVLWHCTAGKDRVGIGTALLLTALGADQDTVIRDFVKTNDYVMERVEKMAGLVFKETGDIKLVDCVRVLLTVSEDYLRHAFSSIEKSFGTIDKYLTERIGLSEEKKQLLRRKFLTETFSPVLASPCTRPDQP
ncbi:tyrosine-protein phosphatase [Clostridium sp. Marseille-P2415]|uniref:tyrosine-protein phosphatase n=1 Tax=Clostridium sp. Marseille-P2415 TaxID=1805471 RepID=UPI0013565A39|nr:tyrosine-protein phosphatase [Clostridium sp. Marseille-P2415]